MNEKYSDKIQEIVNDMSIDEKSSKNIINSAMINMIGETLNIEKDRVFDLKVIEIKQ